MKFEDIQKVTSWKWERAAKVCNILSELWYEDDSEQGFALDINLCHYEEYLESVDVQQEDTVITLREYDEDYSQENIVDLPTKLFCEGTLDDIKQYFFNKNALKRQERLLKEDIELLMQVSWNKERVRKMLKLLDNSGIVDRITFGQARELLGDRYESS
jgi:hypothetical protein